MQPTPQPVYLVPQTVNRPAQMMSFGDSIKTVFSKFVDFSGRASRSEFWWFTLFSSCASIVLGVFDGFILVIADVPLDSVLWMLSPMSTLFSLIVILPSLGVAVRRLHDSGKSGWSIFIVLVPCVGIILYFIWLIQEGEPHDNMYGAVPTNII